MGQQQVRVNVPGFALELYDRGEVTLRTPVGGGDPRHQTPIFNGERSYLVFRPYWNIPDSIARHEIIPKAADDPAYLDKQNIQVLDGWSSNPERIPPSDVEWNSSDSGYRLRQAPGPDNALGLVKVMVPNPHNVYLHDTNAPWLFDRARTAPDRTGASVCRIHPGSPLRSSPPRGGPTTARDARCTAAGARWVVSTGTCRSTSLTSPRWSTATVSCGSRLTSTAMTRAQSPISSAPTKTAVRSDYFDGERCSRRRRVPT
ncbi:MAG: L,D-transpeptidase family protein [Vicinamibacterales bacterium]